jgi:hypothetical protein
VLDATLATPTLHSRIGNWKVWADESSLSDHQFIRFDVLSPSRTDIRWGRNVRNTDWSAYGEALEQNLDGTAVPATISSNTEIDSLADLLGQAVQEAYTASCPLKAYKGKKSAPWWNPTLGILRRKAKSLQRRASG